MTSDRRQVSLSHGATLRAPGHALFQFWAPDVAAVGLEIEDRPPALMRAEGGGWHRLEVECSAGARYRYRVAPDLAVPDPASRAQAADVHGPSLVVDPRTYAWRNAGWRGRPWHEAVLYELHPGLLGGFRGVAEHLPRLAELGVTAVELMPVADFFGAHNWGYDGVLQFAPDAAYGTPDDLKALIDRAHDLGLMMIQDVVYNHFGPEGNYLHCYASGFFRPERHTPWGAAIDFRHPVVRRFFIENALYWLEEFQFDGLRLDAVQAITERDWLLELAVTVRKTFRNRHVHLILENDNNDADLLESGFTAQWNDDAHHAAHVLITGESGGYYSDYADHPAAALARCLAEGFAFQGEASAYRDGAHRGSASGRLAPLRFVFFLQNHDQIGNRAFGERLAAIADPDLLRVGVALLLLSPQIPLLFMGEEQGIRDPFLYFTNYAGALADAVRNGRRKEFGKFAEFATPEAQSRIPDPNKSETFAQSRPDFGRDDDWARQWRAFYQHLLALRRDEIVPRLERARATGASTLSDRAIQAQWTLGDGAALTLQANFGVDAVVAPSPTGQLVFACGPSQAADMLGGKSFRAVLREAP